jgi:hypothetical protein
MSIPPTDTWARVLAGALTRLQAALAGRSGAASATIGLRELYDLWIACAEAAWAEVAREPEFARDQATALASLRPFMTAAAPWAGPPVGDEDVETLRARIQALEAEVAVLRRPPKRRRRPPAGSR